MWYWYLIIIINVIFVLTFIIILSLKIKQRKLNMMLNLYKVKHNLPFSKIRSKNHWNRKIALVCSLFIVFNVTGAGFYHLVNDFLFKTGSASPSNIQSESSICEEDSIVESGESSN